MSKLYIFGIGGTGARVLKSLTFLLASGVGCNSDTIVPILIDPDAANGDVSRSTDVLRKYQAIRKELNFDNEAKNEFFKTPIESLTPNFNIRIQNSNKKFKEFIEYSTLDKKNKALISLLFSEKNLNADMEVGFKGNPNMGSVVLNQFNQSEDFASFASSFSQGDKIFIVSSIFGGTGASGFPLLLKNIRSADVALDNFALLREAPIGAISVLPYFGVKKDQESDIEKSTFVSKTKAALRYYQHGVNNDVNAMYYIGDSLHKDYENNEGSTLQKNDAHFIELASALAVLNFANSNIGDERVVKEFGIENDTNNITFNDLNEGTKGTVFKPLTQYYLFHLYLKKQLKNNLDMNFASTLGINSSFLSGDFYVKLRSFNDEYWAWLNQMSANERGFSPFTLEENNSNILDSVKGIQLKNGGFFQGRSNYERFTENLSKTSRAVNKASGIENRFIENFYLATEKLVKEK
ncbi:hypothetical protein Celal_0825 [Cellulophaga algicola DSM 14237]|uniref:Uncharacterized protein n=1 Tax=Cellulophaga algicola (strain DSM 14237 / IC166 / ACAM 630) TaxID=688270 RepID=E6XEV3_CELAD|nr:hypothetical protein [Cellulophaga algicola]ADV48155.1 hypothetical protein Celal_0825 [Cellulophaga algicola DSM 14237]